ncbi:hypothetical protein HN011_005728, partial [Eciton burchellii]
NHFAIIKIAACYLRNAATSQMVHRSKSWAGIVDHISFAGSFRMRASEWQAAQVCGVNGLQSKREKAADVGHSEERQWERYRDMLCRGRRGIKSIPKRISQFCHPVWQPASAM